MFKPLTEKEYNKIWKVLDNSWFIDALDYEDLCNELYTMCGDFDKEYEKPPTLKQKEAASARFVKKMNKIVKKMNTDTHRLATARHMLYAFTFTPELDKVK